MPTPMDPMDRVTRPKSSAKTTYDRLSRWYDILTWDERRIQQRGLSLFAPQAGETILEIGFATGYALEMLSNSVGAAGTVVGIDLSPEMARRAQMRLRDAIYRGNTQLTIGDAAALPFQDNYFDAVFSSFTLELFDTPEIPVVLSECRRVLKPGGRLAIISLALIEPEPLASRVYRLAHRSLPNVVDCRPIYVARSLEDAAFHIQKSERLYEWGLPVDLIVASPHPSTA